MAGVILTESHITNAMLAVQDRLGLAGEFTTVIDDHSGYLGYLIEIQGDLSTFCGLLLRHGVYGCYLRQRSQGG